MRYRVVLICCVFLCCFCISSYASHVIPATLDSMTALSDTIVVGYVTQIESYSEEGRILTRVKVDVEQFAKNSKRVVSNTVEVRYLGGKVGDTAMEVQGAPSFELNEKVLLFLKKINDHHVIFGHSYGKYSISYDDAEGVEFIDGPLFHNPVQYDIRTLRNGNSGTLKRKDIVEPMGRKRLSPFIDSIHSIVE